MLVLVYEALDRSQKCKACHRHILEEVSNSSSARGGTGCLLRAVLPILHVHSETSEVALAHVTSQSFGINRILHELEECANDLRKYAEQNHTLADQLDSYSHNMTPGHNNILAKEKRAIAEIEDAVVERIDDLVCLALGSSRETIKDEETSASANDGSSNAAMSDLCEVIFLKHQAEKTSVSSVVLPQLVGNGSLSESQVLAAEALKIMQSNLR